MSAVTAQDLEQSYDAVRSIGTLLQIAGREMREPDGEMDSVRASGIGHALVWCGEELSRRSSTIAEAAGDYVHQTAPTMQSIQDGIRQVHLIVCDMSDLLDSLESLANAKKDKRLTRAASELKRLWVGLDTIHIGLHRVCEA